MGLLIFCGHYSGILIDFGREVYYPEQILQGKILYKDLFNIYGPLSYQINALLYKVIGAKLATLYLSGWVCSILTISGIYLIAKKFFGEFLSFCIGFLIISIGVTTTGIFNYHFPYSWAVLYGLVSFLYSLYFLLKFNNDKKSLNLVISSLLAGICIANKYDFLLYGFVILFFIIKNKNWKAFLSFISIPLLSFGILFIQGLSINNLINSLTITSAMAKSETLAFFYQNSGIYFHPKALLIDLISFLKFIIPFGAILYGAFTFNKNNKILPISVSVLGYLGYLCFFSKNIKVAFGFLPICLLISLIVMYKKFDSKLLILVISALAVSAKVFWVLLLYSYGNYYFPILLIAILALIFKMLPEKLEKTVGIYLIIASIFYLFTNFHTLTFVNNKVTTPKGTIYTIKNLAKSTNELNKFINQSTKPTDKIVIFPEGMTVNFLTQRDSDGFYNSLLPLYTESLGEDKIINHYKENMPEYIIFNNLNMKDYYFQYICNDYALDFCGFVQENYKLVTVIDNGFRYMIFKHK